MYEYASEPRQTELHQWIADYKPGTAEYVAGIHESMRRVAYIEELMKRNKAPAREP